MVDFVEAIRPIWGEITGLPVNLVESARATWDSLKIALLFSVGAITLLLLVLWRSLSDTLVVLSPLLLAVLICQVSTVILPISLNFANVIVMPLLGYDKRGTRLGYGGGYYDRTLTMITKSPRLIGYAFASQEIEDIPREPHDIPLSAVVTEAGYRTFVGMS